MIATVLIIMGYIGIVGVIVTLIRSFAIEYGSWLPTLRRLVFVLIGVYALYFIFSITPPAGNWAGGLPAIVSGKIKMYNG